MKKESTLIDLNKISKFHNDVSISQYNSLINNSASTLQSAGLFYESNNNGYYGHKV